VSSAGQRPAGPARAGAGAARWCALLALVAAAGCSSSAAEPPETPDGPVDLQVDGTGPTDLPSAQAAEPADAVEDAVEHAEPSGGASTPSPAEALPVAALGTRLTPDVLVRGPRTFSAGALERLAGLSPAGGAMAFRAGGVSVGGQAVPAVGVDPSSFRRFAAKGTAEATAVWQAVARGEAVVSHAAAKELGLELGKPVELAPAPREGQPTQGSPTTLRVGAFATVGLPGTDVVVDDRTARSLGIPSATGMLLTAQQGQDPVELADSVRAVTGTGATVDLLTPPAAAPTAFLTGGAAAEAFGAFSYRYFPDGTIQPDAAWVRANIVTTNVPVLGRVTCHRLMVPQLRGALQDVQDAGLGHLLRTYDGCYVPRFIARNPDNSISLHTWGIAIDMDASTNYRGIRGTMDMRIVDIFKRWGFRWGGDWSYTDPMHFEMGALMTEPPAR
jgi:hypothetical protein